MPIIWAIAIFALVIYALALALTALLFGAIFSVVGIVTFGLYYMLATKPSAASFIQIYQLDCGISPVVDESALKREANRFQRNCGVAALSGVAGVTILIIADNLKNFRMKGFELELLTAYLGEVLAIAIAGGIAWGVTRLFDFESMWQAESKKTLDTVLQSIQDAGRKLETIEDASAVSAATMGFNGPSSRSNELRDCLSPHIEAIVHNPESLTELIDPVLAAANEDVRGLQQLEQVVARARAAHQRAARAAATSGFESMRVLIDENWRAMTSGILQDMISDRRYAEVREVLNEIAAELEDLAKIDNTDAQSRSQKPTASAFSELDIWASDVILDAKRPTEIANLVAHLRLSCKPGDLPEHLEMMKAALFRAYHPDGKPRSGGGDRFALISQAYTYLVERGLAKK